MRRRDDEDEDDEAPAPSVTYVAGGAGVGGFRRGHFMRRQKRSKGDRQHRGDIVVESVAGARAPREMRRRGGRPIPTKVPMKGAMTPWGRGAATSMSCLSCLTTRAHGREWCSSIDPSIVDHRRGRARTSTAIDRSTSTTSEIPRGVAIARGAALAGGERAPSIACRPRAIAASTGPGDRFSAPRLAGARHRRLARGRAPGRGAEARGRGSAS